MGAASQKSLLVENNASVVLLFPHTEDGGVADVERIDQFKFYELGRAFQRVAKISGDVSPSTVVSEIMAASNAIEYLLSGEPMPISVSRARTEALKTQLDWIKDSYFYETASDGKRVFKFPEPDAKKIPAFAWDFFRSALAQFETVFMDEMAETAIYYVPRRGIYWTPALVDSADESFPQEIRFRLPEKTIVDWRAAGRCLAFNLLSASGFHVARAVEGTLESYYQLFSGQPGATLHGWNDYIQGLETIRKSGATPSPSSKTLTELRQMKDDYRNPIMHPRVVLSEADARMLFANGESLIIAMGQEIEVASAGVQPTLLAGFGSGS